MNIILNGTPSRLPEDTTLAELIERLELTGKRIAIEVNEAIVPRSRFAEHRLRPGDKVEVVHAIGGG